MAPTPQDAPPVFAALSGEFEFVREIGRGGMARVYLARDRDLGREVAVKVVSPDLLGDPEVVARFKREVETVGKLSHPKILLFHAVKHWSHDGLAVVMQYVSGGTVQQLMARSGPLPILLAEQVLRDVAEALAHAHRRRIIHRDLKPENVFLDSEAGRALLGDFGIALALDERVRLSGYGQPVGTPNYMAPEQIECGTVDARSDVYALGLLGHAMLSGKRPWDGDSLTTVMHKQLHVDLPAVATVRPEVSRRLADAIGRALVKSPSGRWQRAEDFLAALGPEGPRVAVPSALAGARAPEAPPARAEPGVRKAGAPNAPVVTPGAAPIPTPSTPPLVPLPALIAALLAAALLLLVFAFA